jgi:hypothetical protein
MDASVLALWRDLSLIWLILLAMIFVAVPGVMLFFALRVVRYVHRWVRLPLLHAQLWALRIEYGTKRASDAISEVPIRLHSRGEQARVTLRGVIEYLRGS